MNSDTGAHCLWDIVFTKAGEQRRLRPRQTPTTELYHFLHGYGIKISSNDRGNDGNLSAQNIKPTSYLLASAPRDRRRAAAPCGVLVFFDASNVGSLRTIELASHVDVVVVDGGGTTCR